MSRTADWARDHLVVLVQPGGALAVWSTGARTLVLRDATDQQVTDHLVARSLTGGGGGPDGGAHAERRALHAARWAVGRARQGLQPRIHLPRWEDVAASGPGAPARP
ncbi:hypothetical protein AB2L28_03430 [Kineococcus sp. TBRC 1896]|uniref:Uncharacterized protein n=1 Tax=Kineococcus mangrovi TaxID=1660183 RepID=A0ABV4HXZ1_9ACTN